MTIRDQVWKPTNNPKVKWVFFRFRRVRQIDMIEKKKEDHEIPQYIRRITRYREIFGPEVEKYYS